MDVLPRELVHVIGRFVPDEVPRLVRASKSLWERFCDDPETWRGALWARWDRIGYKDDWEGDDAPYVRCPELERRVPRCIDNSQRLMHVHQDRLATLYGTHRVMIRNTLTLEWEMTVFRSRAILAARFSPNGRRLVVLDTDAINVYESPSWTSMNEHMLPINVWGDYESVTFISDDALVRCHHNTINDYEFSVTDLARESSSVILTCHEHITDFVIDTQTFLLVHADRWCLYDYTGQRLCTAPLLDPVFYPCIIQQPSGAELRFQSFPHMDVWRPATGEFLRRDVDCHFGGLQAICDNTDMATTNHDDTLLTVKGRTLPFTAADDVNLVTVVGPHVVFAYKGHPCRMLL